MAVLYISEYSEVVVRDGGIAIAKEPAIASQTIAIGGASVQSKAFNAATAFIRVHTDAICAVEVGANPTAIVASGTVGSKRLAANQTEYFGVPMDGSGVGAKLAV